MSGEENRAQTHGDSASSSGGVSGAGRRSIVRVRRRTGVRRRSVAQGVRGAWQDYEQEEIAGQLESMQEECARCQQRGVSGRIQTTQ